LLIPHAALTFLPSCNYSRVQSYNDHIKSDSLYNVVVNYRETHGLLADYAAGGLDIVVPTSHLYQYANEGNDVIDGVYYVFKQHYWKSDGSFYTFGHIDMDDTGSTVTTVDQSRTSNTVLDVTF
jgi:hypothetical protein